MKHLHSGLSVTGRILNPVNKTEEVEVCVKYYKKVLSEI